MAHFDDSSYMALYEVKIQPGRQDIGRGGRSESTHKLRPQLLEPVIKFSDHKGMVVPEHPHLTSARFLSPSKLYLWLKESVDKTWTINTTSSTCITLWICFQHGDEVDHWSHSSHRSPQSHKPCAIVISAYGKLYHLANPQCWPGAPPSLSHHWALGWHYDTMLCRLLLTALFCYQY